jgi:serine/threonine-protein kinase
MIALLGRGGMGQVYRARDPRLDREVAIKVLADTLSQEPGYLERFRREARAVAKLNHPNIVQVYDFGEQGDLTYLVMPLIPGGTLRDLLAQRRKLPLTEALSLAEQVASALQYAHERGLIHRDVKPANILLSAEGRALLSDFGIVRLVQKDEASASLTRMGAFVGSPEYAAPEMVTGGRVDQRVDIYALGVMLFQMLTGQLPFAAPTPMALLMMQTQQQPPSLRSLNPAIPPAVEVVVLKALAKKPEDRYQTAAALMNDLRAAAAAPSVETRVAQVPPGAIGDLPTVATYGLPPAPGSGPAAYPPAVPGSGPAAYPIPVPGSGPAAYPPAAPGSGPAYPSPLPGSGPAAYPPAMPGSGPAGWATPASGPAGWANPGSGPAMSPPLAPTYMTGLSALPGQSPNPPAPLPPAAQPRRPRRMRAALLIVLAFVLVAGGGATLAVAASLGLFKGATAQTGTTPTVPGVTPTPRPSPTPTTVAVPSVYYMAHFYVTMNGDLANGDTVGNNVGINNANYAQHEGPNGDVYQEGTALSFAWGAGIAQVVSDTNNTPHFVVLVDRFASYLDADQYFQHQVKLIQGQATAQSVGDGAFSGKVPDNGGQTFQLFVRDANILITLATYPSGTAQDMSAYFVSIAKAIMQRGHNCTYSTDGKLMLLSSNNPNACK